MRSLTQPKPSRPFVLTKTSALVCDSDPQQTCTGSSPSDNCPKVGKPAKRYLNHEQVRDLADAVDTLGKGMYRGERNGYGLLVKILAYCGLRWGEASGLRVKDIDFKRGRLEVQHTIVEVDGVQLDSQPKDYEARSIPVPASLLAELKTHVEGKEAGSPAFAAARGGWLRGRVFRHGWFENVGPPLGRSHLGRVLRPLRQ